MSEEFGNLAVEQFLNPIFTGAKWNQVGNVPAKKKPKPKTTPTPTQTSPCKKRTSRFGCQTSGASTSPTPTFTTSTGLPTTSQPTTTSASPPTP